MSEVTSTTLVLASSNQGKLRELQALLPDWIEVRTAADLAISLPDETGTTFAENALLKARAAAEQAGMVALADDSGLEVDALDGRPGVRSARFAGEPSDDAANNALLLRLLRDVPPERRGARFRSVVAVVTPEGEEFVADGEVRGRIIDRKRGELGFGYDPVFVPDGVELTMAELGLEKKNSISHRGRALRLAAGRLIPLLEERRAGSSSA